MEVQHYIDHCVEVYYIKEKLQNDQTVEFGFNLDHCTNNTDYWNIYLSVYSKRKHKGYNEDNILSTGKNNPFETYHIIKDALPILEQQIISGNPKFWRKNIFFVHWTDSKRRDVYYRFLKRYGYSYGMVNNKKALIRIA